MQPEQTKGREWTLEEVDAYYTLHRKKIEGLISSRHKFLNGEEKEEAIEETVAVFWKEFSKLAMAGRDVESLLYRIICFAADRVRSGRGVTNRNPDNDVLSERCRFRNKHSIVGIPLTDREPTAREVTEAMGSGESPADLAVLKSDFDAWLATLKPQQRNVAVLLEKGFNQREIADIHKVSRARIWQIREELRASWVAFFGGAAPNNRRRHSAPDNL